MNPLLLTDFYKVHHHRMYPEGTTMIYSNLTPRKSRMKGVNEVVVFGIQHFILEYLIKRFNEEFFCYDKHGGRWASDRARILEEYARHAGAGIDLKHVEALWDLGYLPIEIKALPEGTKCPIGVPMLTIRNTHPDFYWVTNYLETLMSCMLWQPMTSATIAHEYKKILSKYAIETTGSADFVVWQGHDFSMRGMSSVESAILSGMGHLTSFCGTDTIPAIYQLEQSYNANGLIGASVPATEHSVMCMGTKDDEIGTFKALLDKYPTGILSVVSDTWDLWKVCTEYLPKLKDQIMKRDGKLVIRPDSGDPVDIICGIQDKHVSIVDGEKWLLDPIVQRKISDAEHKGVIELLWDTFGGTVNEYGYKVLDPHIGAIYGDSITLERAKEILERLKQKGFASTNIVLGIGSYTYQYNTRDTFGFAVKATYGEVKKIHAFIDREDGSKWTESDGLYSNNDKDKVAGHGWNEANMLAKGFIPLYIQEPREIFKDPITDDGTKKSKKGLLVVQENANTGEITVEDQMNWELESLGLLQTVFKDGKLIKETTLEEIRERLKV